MDAGDRDKVETDKKNEDSLNYNASRVDSDWHSGGANFANLSMGMVPDGNTVAVCKGDLVNPSSLSSMVDSFGLAIPAFWEQPANSQPLGFNSVNAHGAANIFDKLGLTRAPGSSKAGIEAGWEAPNSMLKSGVFLSAGLGGVAHNLSPFPADSAFIERAARFSSFSMGNIGDMVNTFGINKPVNAFHQVAMMPQDPEEVLGSNSAREVSGREPQKNEVNPPSTSKDVSLFADHRGQKGSPKKHENKNGGFDDDTKQAGSDKVHTADSDSQDEPSLTDTGAEPCSAKGLGSKKRRRGGQDTVPKQSGETDKENVKQDSPASPSNMSTGKNGKQNSQSSDPTKEEYIHVRARRGQATNSHSLAERVRREKISERMKFLQDLVPGCSKVTGKAVMLDEIINYVQSLQRQVEFLSMKLATVNPRLDCSIESLLAKEQMFAARAGPPTLGLSPDMPFVYPPLHPSQLTAIQSGLPIIGSSSDALRNIHSQLTSINEGYKESTPQMHNLWDDELHNVVQMGFNPNPSHNNQDTNGSEPPGHMKVEL